MPRESPLPPEWACLEGLVHSVQQVTLTEFSSSCPSCGDSGHTGREKSDRCRLFTDGGHPRLWCRKCNFVAYPDQYGEGKFPRPTPQQLGKWKEERQEEEAKRKVIAEKAATDLRNAGTWEQYHRGLNGNNNGRNYWKNRGIPDKWQDYWGLGWKGEYYVTGKDNEKYFTPTATIPLFAPGREILNIKHRLVAPPDGVGKYRYEIRHQIAPMFLTRPDRELDKKHVIAIEGELKAAITFIYMEDNDACMVGLPGTNPPPGIIEELSKCESVILVFDPGSEEQGERLARSIGRKTRLLILPNKVDDTIIQLRAKPYAIRAWLRQAREIF